MATAFYPQIDICRIDATGYRVAVVSTTIDVYDVTGAGSLGTIASDANGVVVQGSKTGTQAGNVIELSVAGEPLTQRFVLQATQAEAYTAVGNNFASYVVENLFTSTTNSSVVHLYGEDLDNPLTEPIYLGQGLAGTTAEIPYQTILTKNLRIKAISIDDNQNRSSANLQAVTNYQDITIPGSNTTLLFSHFADAATTGTSEQVLYTDTLPANTFAVNGDVISVKYAGIFDATNTASMIIVSLGGTAIFTTDDFVSLILDGTHWEVNLWIVRVNNTTLRCTVSFLSPGEDAFIQYTLKTGLALATTAYDIELKAQTDTAGDVTAKMAHAVYMAAP